MPAKSTTAAPSLHMRLLEGSEFTSRKDGSVHTVKINRKAIAEICVGARAVRLNVRSIPKSAPKGLLGGKSKTWAGGVIVTADNLAACRAVLSALVKESAATTATARAPRKPATTRKASTPAR